MRYESHVICNRTTGRKAGTCSYDGIAWSSEEFKAAHFLVYIPDWALFGKKYRAFIKAGERTAQELINFRADYFTKNRKVRP
jgi:hypothetical protein